MPLLRGYSVNLFAFKQNENETMRLKSKKTEMNDESGSDLKLDMKDRLYEIREMIDNHVEDIHENLVESAKKTLKFIQIMQKSNKNLHERPISTEIVKLDPTMFVVRRLWNQVASETDSSETASADQDDVDVAFNSQPRRRTSKAAKLKKRNKKKPRLTKGEEDEISARISKSDKQRIMARISRFDDESESVQSEPAPMLKLVMVNTKIDRFKRKAKPTKTGKKVTRRRCAFPF